MDCLSSSLWEWSNYPCGLKFSSSWKFIDEPLFVSDIYAVIDKNFMILSLEKNLYCLLFWLILSPVYMDVYLDLSLDVSFFSSPLDLRKFGLRLEPVKYTVHIVQCTLCTFTITASRNSLKFPPLHLSTNSLGEGTAQKAWDPSMWQCRQFFSFCSSTYIFQKQQFILNLPFEVSEFVDFDPWCPKVII